jgi:hypothetical protein
MISFIAVINIKKLPLSYSMLWLDGDMGTSRGWTNEVLMSRSGRPAAPGAKPNGILNLREKSRCRLAADATGDPRYNL